ncbi:hypothetical protein VE04_06899 [Pseudogymnoascus sp. 24MN13]|nr:hypothetical protein VE04_06899 [Pseudogymnoascus sp. 24MN13]
MSSRDRKLRNIPMFPKSPIATPPRAALQGQGRSRSGSVSNNAATNSRPSSPEPPTSQPPSQPPSQPTSTSPSAAPSRNPSTKSTTIDKDDRIAHLEADAAVMEGTFEHEVEHLSAKLGHQAEVAHFWQLNAEIEERAGELDERAVRERDSTTRISSLLIDREGLREGFAGRDARRTSRESEVEGLRAQVRGLKEFVSTSGRSEGQVTDEVIAKSSSAIMDIKEVKEETRERLEELCPLWERLAGTAKVHLIQSIVSMLLVKRVFQRYFVGLPEEREKELIGFEAWLASTSGSAGDVNQWRSSTLGLINKKGSLDNLGVKTEEVAASVVREAMAILEDITDVERDAGREVTLRALIIEAITLSRMLRVQKASFKPIMTVVEGHQINIFDSETMDDIGGEDEETLEGRDILCMTFPGVLKEGDENGQRMQLRKIIARSKVLCSPD